MYVDDDPVKLTAEEIYEKLWHEDGVAVENTVMVHI
ncbi:MAG: winged helix-turn-helix domain-containing protein [Lachnospiraceae bacterium]|nr:winged helix-turn-helix domain-containing protein [Lachnospiraceae bacterium]